jgi:hypothetical protein
MTSTVSTEIRVPRLASASSAQSGLPHSLWRPQMQTLLMRCGVEERDYSREFPEWKRVVATIDAEVEAEEEAAFAAVLGTAASSAAPAVKKQALTAEEQKQKQRVIAAIARMRKAYALLYAALPADLRALVADVPQGYAFGIWSMLEKKFRNTEQDSVMALWERLISLRQEREPEESFDEYKARVDAVVELLHNAKQTVEPGLYTSLLLWRLQPHYATAVLTLKTGDRLKDPSKIDWTYIVEYMGQFERSQLGLNDRDMEPGGDSNYHAYSARHKQRYNGDRSKKPRGYNDLTGVKCYNCNQLGHYASDCSRPDRRQQNKQRRGDKPRDEDSESTSEIEDSDQHTDGAGASDSDDADESRQRRRRVDEQVNNMSRALSNMKLGKRRDTDAEHTARTSTAGRSYLMRASIAIGQEQHQKQTRPEQESHARSQREPNRRARGIGAAAVGRHDTVTVKESSLREGTTLKNSVEHESQLQGGC